MRPKNPILNDIGAERATLAGILRHGADALIDIEEILTPNDFYGPHFKTLFSVMRNAVHDRGVTVFDIPVIMGTMKLMGFDRLIDPKKDDEFLDSLFKEQIAVENVAKLAAVVFKLSIARQAWICLNSVKTNVEKLKGDEPIDAILGMIEDPIFGFTGQIISKDTAIEPLAAGHKEAMLARMEKPKDIVGLPTGFPKYDFAIGGGMRPGGITVVGARPKIGKSFWCLNIAFRMAQAKIPVLILDTELPRKMQRDRLLALATGVETARIETGNFAGCPDDREAVLNAGAIVDNLPLMFCSIAGQSVKNVLSIVRRWLVRHVGLTAEGKAKPCAVFYDYLKLMDSGDIKSNMAEYQLLGFLLTEMHNFALKYDLPIMATVQLNRDGSEKENSDVISGSDRILWLATSFSILKRKSKVEIKDDPPKPDQSGRLKLVVTDARAGIPTDPGDYINIVDDLARASMKEGGMGQAALAHGIPQNKQHSGESED